MTDKDREALQAFTQKMQQEGADGFAAGPTPWDNWDEFEEQVGSQRQTWQGKVKPVAERKAPSHSFGDRVLTTMTALAIVTLVIGIAGVFLTQQPDLQVAENYTQLPSTDPVITTEIQLPPEEDIVFNDEPVSAPTTGIIMRNNMAAWDLSIDQDGNPALPAILAEDDKLFTALDELPATAAGAVAVESPAGQVADTDSSTITAETDTGSQLALATLNELPAPAAGTAQEPPTIAAPSEAAVEVVSEEPPVFREIIMAEPENSTPAEPVLWSKTNLPDVHTEPELLPARDISENKQIVNYGGEWSINLASYLKLSTAEKMRKQFLDKGVAADLVTAIVNGKIYYRLRVTGIENKNMALIQSTIIKERLGLEDAWITKE